MRLNASPLTNTLAVYSLMEYPNTSPLANASGFTQVLFEIVAIATHDFATPLL